MSPVVETAAPKPSVFPYAIAIGGGLFAFAFVAAPYSCEWGLSAYFIAGILAMIVLFLVPFRMLRDAALAKRMLLGLGLAAAGLAIWIAGLFAANVQLLCRLF